MTQQYRLFKRSIRVLQICGCRNSASSSNEIQKTHNSSSEWQTVIGLEIHAQISSKSKLFSGAEAEFGGLVNNCVSLFDAAIPGTLPVLNKRCVEAGILAALSMSCDINRVSMFDRKHYFYADMPAGYQITQQRAPIAQNGSLEFQVFSPGVNKKQYRKVSQIKQIQLEQDSGKSLHDEALCRSLVDLNRAGTPLIEVVFEPDLEDAEEAAALVKELILLLDRLGCCNGKMEEGALRVDANVSVHRKGEQLGTRTEIKNIGSIRAVASAIKHEASRQVAILESGGIIVNETRSWDAVHKLTVAMRDKEVKQDYRFMPEPNLPPLILNMTTDDRPGFISVPLLREQIPELPEETRQKLISQYGLTLEVAIQLVNENILLNHFTRIMENKKRKAKQVANILIMEYQTSLNSQKISIENCNLPSEIIGNLCDMLESREINIATGRKVMDILVCGTLQSPEEIVEANDWRLINDDAAIETLCLEVLQNNPKLVAQYKAGKTKVFKALTGILNANAKDKANMAKAVVKLEELLKK